ncbi:MAG: DUF881 domain-containing protein [Jatrophihabitans sp.]
MPSAAWRTLVPVVALAAGLLFATSARASHGTDLRGSSTANLVDLVRSAQAKATKLSASARTLDVDVQQRTSVVASSDTGVAAQQRRSDSLEDPAGLVAERGPGLVVVLDDSPRKPDPGIDANNYVIHQSDLQAVVNALWAGGAEAMSISGQRIIATSAVRCVGNTLLINGQLFSPPFRIEAIGPSDTMRAALDRSYGVSLIRQAVDALGLGFSVDSSDELHLPAFDGTVGLSYATVP